MKGAKGDGFWIGSLRLFSEFMFVVLILLGLLLGNVTAGIFNIEWLSVVVPIVFLVVGILSVGFVLVYLNMAVDMKNSRYYLFNIATDMKEMATGMKEVATDMEDVVTDMKEVTTCMKDMASGMRNLTTDMEIIKKYLTKDFQENNEKVIEEDTDSKNK